MSEDICSFSLIEFAANIQPCKLEKKRNTDDASNNLASMSSSALRGKTTIDVLT